MNYYEALANTARDTSIEEQDTSYFSEPSKALDPTLFQGQKLRSNVREAILVLLHNHLALGYNESESWATAYLAGSGVSYSWSAYRSPKDLDCLVSINYQQFRRSNQEYKGWSDKEIVDEINQGFRNELLPRTDNFMGQYELTFYVNLNPNIEQLKPYAAISVTDDRWLVPPTAEDYPHNPEWQDVADRDAEMAKVIVSRYTDALDKVRAATNPAHRTNAEHALAHAVTQASAMFEDIHGSRSTAFSPEGAGYADFSNYRWQAGKRSGAISALKRLHDYSKEAESNFSTETYGMELPDVSTLMRRTYPK
jgi:hypothetical protein